MFRDTRKKQLRNRIIFAAIGVAVMTFGIWINYQSEYKENKTENAAQEVEVKKSVADTEQKQNNGENSYSLQEESDEQDAQGTDTQDFPETYLIKEVDGTVKVFICDADGNQELYLITSIPFELLSESDQQLFKEGVKINTQDDLGKFLENFDS